MSRCCHGALGRRKACMHAVSLEGSRGTAHAAAAAGRRQPHTAGRSRVRAAARQACRDAARQACRDPVPDLSGEQPIPPALGELERLRHGLHLVLVAHRADDIPVARLDEHLGRLHQSDGQQGQARVAIGCASALRVAIRCCCWGTSSGAWHPHADPGRRRRR